MKSSNLISKERWVCCPSCGKKVQKAWISYSDCACSCGLEFTACVTKHFVTTILHEKGDDMSMEDRIKTYLAELSKAMDI